MGTSTTTDVRPFKPLPLELIRLARPHQWIKNTFVLAGPLYGAESLGVGAQPAVMYTIATVLAFGLISSANYALNDILDARADAQHPRKCQRPIACGAVKPRAALIFAAALAIGSAAALFFIPQPHRMWVALCVLLYAMNTITYSMALKHKVIADVMCLSMGFVFRVLAGCAAVGAPPSVWLLNTTLFVAMFLAFGKRLGERRTMHAAAVHTRSVQMWYTDSFLLLAVTVTCIATLLGYTIYITDRSHAFTLGFNLLWLTVLPATYGMLRAVILIDRGKYDDPTELALRDKGVMASAACFGVMTAGIYWWFKYGPGAV